MEKEIQQKIEECLNCKNKPCSVKGCPVHTDIPGFIQKMKQEDLEGAYVLLQNNNSLSSICCRVCYQEEQCQGSCVRGIKGNPVSIGMLEKEVNEWARKNKKEIVSPVKKKGKVAIIGSGPSGLTVAHELNKEGIGVTVFEKEKELGGILRYGIPDFRLPKNLIDDITQKLKKNGVIFKTNIELGKQITIEKLKQEGYEEIFLGIGAGKPSTYDLGEKEVYTSDIFLKKYYEKENICLSKEVMIIGGGNVAMDCARTAKKMGAKRVCILYRRDREKMPANNSEVKDCLKEGIEILFLTKVIAFSGKEVTCIKTRLEEGKVKEVENSEYTLPADIVVLAIGLTPNPQLIESIGLHTKDGLIAVDENGMTEKDGIFAGGDLTEKKSTVVRAVASGKKAAQGIINRRKNGG